MMIASLMKHKPKETRNFMINWLEKKGYEMENKVKKRIESRPEGIPTTSESEDDEEEMDAFELE